MCVKNNGIHGGPGWRGAIKVLSTVPTVDWVLLRPTRIRIMAALNSTAACLQDAPCLLAGKACNSNMEAEFAVEKQRQPAHLAPSTQSRLIFRVASGR